MPDKQSPIGVIGQSDAVLAFRTLGMRVIAARSAQQAQAAVHTLVTDGVAVILITDDAARLIPEVLARYDSDPGVTLIPIPAGPQEGSLGMQRLHANVEKAVGADILLNNMEE